MFAGKMKLSTFLTVLVVGATCGAAGFGFAVMMAPDAPPPAPRIEAAPAAVTPSMPDPRPVPVEAPTPAAAPALPAGTRDIDTVVMGYVGKNIGTDKLKDVSQGKPWKVNVYQDSGSATANRAKVDLDRDDKWDEKFTFADGTITRQVAPADDEAYTQEYRWDGTGWAPSP